MTLERLEKTPFTTILGEVLTERRTGRMNLVSNSLRRTLFWSQGELVLVLPEDAKESLGSFLLERQIIEAARVRDLEGDDPTDLVCRLDATEAVPASQLQSLLRQWTTALTLPLFSLEEGTVAFASEEALDPEKRIYVSTPAVVLAGIRQIGSGMVLRASLGDLSRQIEPNPAPCYSLETLPLTEVERKLATKLRDRQTLADLLKSREADSATVSRVTLAMITLGSWSVVEARPETVYDDVEKDLATLAALAGDERALRVVAYARQLQNLDHYQVLDVPRAATRQQIVLHAEELRRKFQRSSYPAAAGDAIQTILNRVEEAVQMLTSPEQRHVYDRLLATAKDQGHGRSLQQQIARRSVAIQNYRKAEELATRGDYYGAIVLLDQSVKFAPDMADAWHLLGVCQEKNPRWRRAAVDSLQRALSIDPNRVDTLLALGDLHSAGMMIGRARSFYEDVLKIDPEHKIARARLKESAKAK